MVTEQFVRIIEKIRDHKSIQDRRQYRKDDIQYLDNVRDMNEEKNDYDRI